MKKKLLLLICAAVILLTPFGSLTAFAASDSADEADLSQKGSISIIVRADNAPLTGAVFGAYKVADAKLSNGELSFDFTEEFDSFGGDIEDVDSLSEINELAEYAKKNNVSKTEDTADENGSIKFDNLTPATYLIVQTQKVQGYSKCDPFLVEIPYYENGVWHYKADASPKTELQKLVDITVSKVWNDGISSKNHKSVKVKLLKDGKIVKTVTLSEDNNWTQVIGDMPQSDSYSVKEVDVPDGYSAVYSSDGLNFTVTNNSLLIQTGQLIWPIPVLSTAGMLLTIIGVYAVRRSRSDA